MNRSEVGAGPGLAIVMPTRNQAAFLAEAVESVFAQDLPGLRLWVQDGASDDGTQALLTRLAERHPGLAWVSEPDAGPADALNRAFARVLSDPEATVIGWLNSDDLYTPGALRRALCQLEVHSDQVAVYGQGRHIDAQGQPLDAYPTHGPDHPLAAWADGCPICQPTMVLRREALEAIQPLDTTLKAAFDFDLWFKLFKRFPGRIGFIDTEQAFSRLHDQGITLSQRRRVALEGLAVIHRHIGPAPGHWLLTCADELMQQWPDGDATPPLVRLATLLSEARPYLHPAEPLRLTQRWRGHRAVELGRPDAWLALEPDGWLLSQTALRLRPSRPAMLVLTGRHAGGQGAPLHLQCEGPHGERHALTVPPGRVFTWRWPVEASPDETQHWRIQAQPTFVPSRREPTSTDHRELACQVTGMQWQT